MSVSPEIRDLVGDWPEGGLVVGVLPDATDPEWSGRRVLELVELAGEDREPVTILDLAPTATHLADRFDADGAPGFAQLIAGEAELEELVRRDDRLPARYLPRGHGSSDADLLRSWSLWRLAQPVREEGGLLIVLLERRRAGAASPGWLDGFLVLGKGDDARLPHDIPLLGRVEGREEPATSDGGNAGEPTGSADEPEEEAPSTGAGQNGWRRRLTGRLGTATIVAVFLAAAGFTAWGMLEGGGEAGGSDSGMAGERATPASESVQAPPRPRAGATVEEDTAPSSSPGDTGGTASSAPSQERRGEEASPAASSESAPTGAEAGAPPPSDPVESALRAVADSLARSVETYFRQERRFRRDSIGCPELSAARERAGDQFIELSLHRLSLDPPLDSAAAALFRERSDAIERVDRSYAGTGCPSPDGS